MSPFEWKQTLWLNALLFACLTSYAWASSTHSIRQSPNISWFDCPDSPTTQCAFFNVPLDYSNPKNNSTVSIFMRKLPARVPADQRLGTILTNPGGPGGSGSAFVASGGDDLSTIVEGKYDIIGFDPRGVNLTSPSTACLNVESKFLLREYQLQLQGAPFPSADNTTQREQIRRLAAIQGGHSEACERGGNQNVLESVGTVAVARDMASITEALGEDGLNFWGYSYGTILGATFAAVKPDLVKRMVLDGVSDSESYFNDILQWGRDSMQNTNKTLTGFLSTCLDAGPNFCSLAVPPVGSNETQTVDSLRKRLDSIYSQLAQEPLIVPDSRSAGSGFLKASDVQSLIFTVLYNPISWGSLADALVQVERGNGVTAYNVLYGIYAQIQPRSYVENIYNRSMQIYGTRESLHPILCGDSSYLNITNDRYSSYIRELGRISPVGEQWGVTVGGCRDWAFRARERYTGPWTTKDGLKKTRFPILFVSLDADPVTPLPSAVKMGRAFGEESATLLIQHGYGHCSIAHPSLCTAQNIRDYFVSGKVPKNGTHCTPEPGYIYPNVNKTEARTSLSKRDEDLLGALVRLRDARSKTLLSGFDVPALMQ
ncbi:TAP-like protein-domain-containing protein [Rhizoctonia solani]|nr:TAP-like protein-domain-containing protein [Rhizoctonia solani]